MTADAETGRAEPDLDPAAVSGFLAESMAACNAWNRTDLVSKLRLAQIRLDRPSTLVCVVGEYKQGKSQLINALTGSPVCPVDDDVATSAITAVYGADEPVARVRRVVNGEAVHEEVAVDQLSRYATEGGDRADREGIELIEVGMPSPALEAGLTLVDTPGVGGVVRQHTSSTLRFLGLADAVIFASDASQELTAGEISFLRRAREVCPTVLVAVTKIDLYPEWQRIVELDRGHLLDTFDNGDLLPISSTLQLEGLARNDPKLQQESGIPGLLGTIGAQVVESAKRENARRAVGEIGWALGRLLQPIDAEIEILTDPTVAEQGVERLQATQGRLKELQEAGSRWSTLLTDGFTDLRGELDFELRTSTRSVLADVDGRIETIDPASDWEPFVRQTQENLSDATAALTSAIDAGSESIRARIDALLSDPQEGIADLGSSPRLDVAAVWESGERELKATAGTGVTGAMASGFTALRGASSGMILLGVIGNLAGVALAAPVSVSAALVFGTKQVVDTRATALKQRRQEARVIVRQYVDEVGLHLGNNTRQQIQSRHRILRDHYSARLQELSASATAALQAAQQNLAKDQSGRDERLMQLEQWATNLRRQLDRIPAGANGEPR
jgi:hypothetical protein